MSSQPPSIPGNHSSFDTRWLHKWPLSRWGWGESEKLNNNSIFGNREFPPIMRNRYHRRQNTHCSAQPHSRITSRICNRVEGVGRACHRICRQFLKEIRHRSINRKREIKVYTDWIRAPIREKEQWISWQFTELNRNSGKCCDFIAGSDRGSDTRYSRLIKEYYGNLTEKDGTKLTFLKMILINRR